MERYLVITDKSGDIYTLVSIIADASKVTVENVARLQKNQVLEVSRGCRLLNFDIAENDIKETRGRLDRLKPSDNIVPCIVLQELATSAGTILGYRLLNPLNYSITAMKKEDIVERQKKSSVPILQNGIIRGNCINCYPFSDFPKVIVGVKKHEPVRKVRNVKEVKNSTEDDNNFLSQFTPEQRKELALAKKDGVPIRLIADPKLSPQQMRVLWVSKAKYGSCSEYFASPKYSVDVMKFYADRLVTEQMVKECADLLNRPDFSLEKLEILYLAICEGVDYSTFIDAPTAEEMRVEYEMARAKMWGTVDAPEFGDTINNAVEFARKLKQGSK